QDRKGNAKGQREHWDHGHADDEQGHVPDQHARDQSPYKFRIILKKLRSGLQPPDQKSAEHNCRRGRTGYTQREKRHHSADRGTIVPGLSRGQPVDSSDRKSTRLNSSHVKISYAVFCLKKKKKY